MKVVYIASQLHCRGGIERIICDKTAWLCSHGVEVEIILTGSDSEAFFYEFDSQIRFHFLGIDYADCRGVRGLLKKAKRKKDHAKQLNSALLSANADITIFTDPSDLFLLRGLTDRSVKICEWHYHRNNSLLSIRYNTRNPFSYFVNMCREELQLFKKEQHIKQLSRFVVLTNRDAKQWRRLDNITAIPNFSNFTCREDVVYTARRVIAVGHLSKGKQFDHLISAWRSIHKLHPDWRLSIFGDGAQRVALQNQIDGLGLQEVIKLEGATKDISKEYSRSSIYAMTSSSEGFGLVILEAMIHHLPVVSYNCPCGPGDLVDNN
ncbi:MAG: glycosyltransferase, partial [Rikenellaceae bacterium]